MAKAAVKNKEKKKTPPASSAPARSLPLFFYDPHPVHLERHAKAGLKQMKNFSFTGKTNSIPLNIVEFFEAARSYPIVFTNTPAPLPVALVGIQEQNYFLDTKDMWLERSYIPAYVRRYPFIFMRDQGGERLILCVDEGAENYAASNPEKSFYDDAGEMSDFTKEALQFCALFEQHYHQTVEFCAALKEHDLLVEKVSAMRLPNGKEERLGGFQMLDGARLDALPDDIFLAWRKKGWIAALDAVMVSYTNWRYISELAAKRQK